MEGCNLMECVRLKRKGRGDGNYWWAFMVLCGILWQGSELEELGRVAGISEE